MKILISASPHHWLVDTNDNENKDENNKWYLLKLLVIIIGA